MLTIKLCYVLRDTDSNGNDHTYFWRKGGRKVRIGEKPGREAERYTRAAQQARWRGMPLLVRSKDEQEFPTPDGKGER